jgi:hypothetical protein
MEIKIKYVHQTGHNKSNKRKKIIFLKSECYLSPLEYIVATKILKWKELQKFQLIY